MVHLLPSYAAVKRSARNLQCRKVCIQEDARCGRLSTSITQENILITKTRLYSFDPP